jgi:hypothetical protein
MSITLKSTNGVMLSMNLYMEFMERHKKWMNASVGGKEYLDENFQILQGMKKERTLTVERPPQLLFESTFFQRVLEITSSIQNIEDVRLITLRKEKKKSQPDGVLILTDNPNCRKAEILKLRYEYFLHIVYIVEQRILALLDWLNKQYKHPNDASTKKELDKCTKQFKQLILELLKGFREHRNTHVHVRELSVQEFSTLSSLAAMTAISVGSKDENIQLFYVLSRFNFNQEYNRMSKIYKKLYADMYQLLYEFCDQMLERLLPIVLSEDQRLLIPQKVLNQEKAFNRAQNRK